MKRIFIFLVALIIIVFAGLQLFNKVEDVVIEEIEKQGRRVFGTEVKVSDLDLDLKQGSANIREITVANPAGFSKPNALTFSNIYAQFDYQSLSISEIIISDPHVFAEFKDSKLNIEELSRQAKKFSPTPVSEIDVSSEETKTEKKSDQDDKESVILIIDLIAMENVKVDLIADILDEEKQFGIDQIEARNLKGTPGQLGNQIANKMLNDLYKKVVTESLKALGRQNLDELKDKLKDKLKSLFD